jgi:zinc transporter ZupT
MNKFYIRFLVEDAAHAEEEEVAAAEIDNKPWGHVIAASLLIQLVTFSGLLILGFSSCLKKGRRHQTDTTTTSFLHLLQHQIVPSFAAGALLATTVFMLIPEGFELLEGAHGQARIAGYSETTTATPEEETHESHRYNLAEEESHEEPVQTAWKFGTALLGGFLFPILLGAIFPPPDVSECEVCRKRTTEAVDATSSRISPDHNVVKEIMVDESTDSGDGNKGGIAKTIDLMCDSGECQHYHDENVQAPKENEAKTTPQEPESTDANGVVVVTGHSRNIPLAASILLGDFCHNFCDGIFLGTAFLLCSESLAYTITFTTIYHELAQEIADFAMLTNHCGLTVPQAVTANFIAGFSVLIGAVIVMVTPLNDKSVGAILILSAGVYVYIAASECIPRIQASRRSAKHTLVFLLCFILGAVPIGLVLLNHNHCDMHQDESQQ